MSYDFNRDMNQWADIEGAYHADRAWLLSSADTWHKNPHYTGHPQPHPDDEVGENDQEPDEEPAEEKKADVWLDPQDIPF